LIKKIDSLGRIVIPKGYRQMLGLKAGDSLDVEVESGRILISSHQDGCTFCESTEIVKKLEGKGICSDCLEKIKSGPHPNPSF
jgi:AbrB family transcriptional regulator, transcriptional pleiotropic regulator of transition state genes